MPGAAQHQLRQETGSRFEVLEVLCVAVAQGEGRVHLFAASFLGEEGDLDPLGHSEPQRAGLEIGRAHIKGFAGSNRVTALVVADQRVHVWRARDGDAFRLDSWNVHTDSAVVALEVCRRDALHVFWGHLFNAIAVQEVEPPITLRGPLAQRDRQPAGLRRREVTGLEDLLPGPLDFLSRHARRADLLDSGDQGITDVFQRTVARHFGLERQHARVVHGAGKRHNAGRFLGFDQGFV